MSSVQRMKDDTALKAASSDADVSVEKAKRLITSYFEYLRLCLLCEGSQRFTYRQKVKVPTMDGQGPKVLYVDTGKEGDCPHCGPDGAGDPDWVMWVCRHPDGLCSEGDHEGENHGDCGWALVFPMK
jgi:hypothetical protein